MTALMHDSRSGGIELKEYDVWMGVGVGVGYLLSAKRNVLFGPRVLKLLCAIYARAGYVQLVAWQC